MDLWFTIVLDPASIPYENASSGSVPVIKTKSGNALDENLCEHKIINSMVDGTASDGPSLRAHPLGQCKDSCMIPERVHH